jgi:hypothetical protein
MDADAVPTPLRSISISLCADSVTNANTTTTEVSSRGQLGWRRGDDETLDSQRFQRFHPPSVGTFTSEVRLPMTLSCRQTRSSRRFTFASPRPVVARSSGYSYSGCVSHYADCRSVADTGSRVNVNYRDPPICWRDPQNKVLIHTYRICIECEPS